MRVPGQEEQHLKPAGHSPSLLQEYWRDGEFDLSYIEFLSVLVYMLSRCFSQTELIFLSTSSSLTWSDLFLLPV